MFAVFKLTRCVIFVIWLLVCLFVCLFLLVFVIGHICRDAFAERSHPLCFAACNGGKGILQIKEIYPSASAPGLCRHVRSFQFCMYCIGANIKYLFVLERRYNMKKSTQLTRSMKQLIDQMSDTTNLWSLISLLRGQFCSF